MKYKITFGKRPKVKPNCWDCTHCETLNYVMTKPDPDLSTAKAWCKRDQIHLFHPDANDVKDGILFNCFEPKGKEL